jgi:hypothetical protein
MNIITKLFKNLKEFYKKDSNKQHTKSILSDSDIVGAITFSLDKNNNVDILCFFPESADMTADEISLESENFGKFIAAITDGLVADSIVKLLDKTKQQSHSTNEQLFIENVLFFWALNHVSNLKTKSNKTEKNTPIIRPTAVFGQTKPLFD